MRELQLPTTNTVSFTLSASEAAASGIVMLDGRRQVSMGSLGDEDFAELNIARDNTAHILWSSICLEQRMDRILIDYFMGPLTGPSSKRQLFEQEVVGNSAFTFSLKKHLIDQITQETEALTGKKRSQLQGKAKKVLEWRNAFAHGSFKLDAKMGVVLCYYSSGPKEKALNDDFLSELEEIYHQCDSLLKELETEVQGERA